MLMWHPTSGRVSDESGRVPYRVKYHVSALAAAPHFDIFFIFVVLLRFSRGFSHILDLFCPFVLFYLICSYVAYPLPAFQFF
jgi:hypothetical protein